MTAPTIEVPDRPLARRRLPSSETDRRALALRGELRGLRQRYRGAKARALAFQAAMEEAPELRPVAELARAEANVVLAAIRELRAALGQMR